MRFYPTRSEARLVSEPTHASKSFPEGRTIGAGDGWRALRFQPFAPGQPRLTLFVG
jgi:hypothetical protein